MAAKQRDLDWVMIRYRDVILIIVLFVLIVGGGGGGYLVWRYNANPQVKADKAIQKATRLIQQLDTPSAGDALRQSLVQARGAMDQARTEYSARQFSKAYSLATDVVKTLNDIPPDAQRLAFLVSQEGSVEVKKVNQHLFTSAKDDMPLEVGDIVKTSRSSYAKIKYPNGQTQSILPDTLVVIQAMLATATGGSRVEVHVDHGITETATEKMGPGDESLITAGNTSIRPAAEARVRINQTEGGNTTTNVLQGKSQVEYGGQVQVVDAGATGVSVVTSAGGSLVSTEILVAPPSVVSPRDRQVLRISDPARTPISFEWQNAGGGEVVFQLSAKPLFSALLAPEKSLKGTNLSVDGLPAGSYYWRVRTSGSEEKAYWSSINQFRIIQVFQRPRVQRELRLEVMATPAGDVVILKGQTDPGINVSVNDKEIPVGPDGSFTTIERFSDRGTQQVEVRAFDEEGNEKLWRKAFQSSIY